MKLVCGVLAVLTLTLTLAGCDAIKEKLGKKADSGSSSTTNTTTTSTTDDDSGAAAADAAADAAPAANEKDIKRFPDEEAVTEAVSVQWPTVDAKTEPGTGKVVTALPKGTAANLVARNGKTVLATFNDPKDATKLLMGWIPEDAFTPGTSPPPVVVMTGAGTPKATGVCAAPLTLLFEADAFCGKVCKVDKDCTAPQTCSGSAKPLNAGGFGAPVTFCAKPKAATPTAVAADAGVKPADAGVTTARPDAGGTVLAPITTMRAGGIK